MDCNQWLYVGFITTFCFNNFDYIFPFYLDKFQLFQTTAEIHFILATNIATGGLFSQIDADSNKC